MRPAQVDGFRSGSREQAIEEARGEAVAAADAIVDVELTVGET